MVFRVALLSFCFGTLTRAATPACVFDGATSIADQSGDVNLLQQLLSVQVESKAKLRAHEQTTDASDVDFVIGVGLPKTATSSLREALKILGRLPAHGETMFSDPLNPAWDAAFHGDNVPALEKLFSQGYNATAGDSPWCFMYEDIMRAIPNYKVIMSMRPRGPDGWVNSTDTWNAFHTGGVYSSDHAPHPFFIGRRITDFPPERLNEHEYASQLDCFINETHNQSWRDGCKQGYLAHNDKVRRAVPQERLLEFNVSDGWASLCSFLNLPVPDVPFPDVNDRTNGHP